MAAGERPELRASLHGLTHYIATPETARHRFFVKFPVEMAPEHSLIVIPRQDDATLGILSSRIHRIWSLAQGGRMGFGNDPRYNASLTFETFPFPPGFDLKAEVAPEGEPFTAIAEAAVDLDAWRKNGSTRRVGWTGRTPRKNKTPAFRPDRSPSRNTLRPGRSAP